METIGYAGQAAPAEIGDGKSGPKLGWWARSELAKSMRPVNPYDEQYGRDPEKIAQALREQAVSLGRNGALSPQSWDKAGLSDPETLRMAGLDEGELLALAEKSRELPPSKTPPAVVAAGMALVGLALLKLHPGGVLAFLNKNPWDKITHFAAGAAIGFCGSDPDLGGSWKTGMAAGTAVGIGKELLDLHFDPLDAAATIAGTAAGALAKKIDGGKHSCNPELWGKSQEEKEQARLHNPMTLEVASLAARQAEQYRQGVGEAPPALDVAQWRASKRSAEGGPAAARAEAPGYPSAAG